MKSFFNIVLYACRYKWSIMGATLASFLIAVLWGASISTVYPVVEIVLDGKSAHEWLQQEIQTATDQSAQFQKEVAELQLQLEQAGDKNLHRLQHEIERKQQRVAAEQAALDWYISVQPMVARYAPHSPFQTLLWALVWLLATSFIKGVLLIFSTLLVARVANRTVSDLRRVYYRKALEMDQQRIDQLGTSNMMTHLSHNMQMISAGLQAFFGRMIREPLKMITCLIGAALISWPLLLISLITVPIGGFLIRYLSKRMKRSTHREIEGMSHVFQTLIETFSSIKTVRIFNREPSERKRFKSNANSLYRISLKISLYDSLLRPITEMLGIISISLSILVGAYLVLNQETDIFGLPITNRPLTPGQLLLFFTMLGGASDPARKMSEVINQLIRGGMVSESLLQTFDVQPTVVPRTPGVVLPFHSQEISFQDVVYAYRPNQPVVKGVSFSVPFGQSVAIVGPNGCGKSTLMNLLVRFYDPHRGKITIDGVDIRDVSPRKLRQQVAWVTQDGSLFQGTIWENIKYGSATASDAEIMRAAELALVTDFTKTMNDGFHTQVGDEGRQLSAGQRQRVALARAILADPRILILDEATSQIDGKTESLLHHGLLDFIRQRTTFVVTHRVSSLKLTDRVLIMDAGRITFDGPTQEAWDQSAEFKYLFTKSAA